MQYTSTRNADVSSARWSVSRRPHPLRRRSADIPVFRITAFLLTGRFVSNLLNQSHIGRARFLPSRGGSCPARPASYTPPDPGAPWVGCCRFAEILVGRAVPRPDAPGSPYGSDAFEPEALTGRSSEAHLFAATIFAKTPRGSGLTPFLTQNRMPRRISEVHLPSHPILTPMSDARRSRRPSGGADRSGVGLRGKVEPYFAGWCRRVIEPQPRPSLQQRVPVE